MNIITKSELDHAEKRGKISFLLSIIPRDAIDEISRLAWEQDMQVTEIKANLGHDTKEIIYESQSGPIKIINKNNA